MEESNSSCNSTLDDFEKDCVQKFYEPGNKILTCINDYVNNFLKNLQKEKCQYFCPLECDSMSFSINNYIEQMPVSGSIGNQAKISYKLDNFSTYEQVNKHWIVINVFYKELKYNLVTQEAKTEIFNFISNIGGILGVVLGVSFLSFIEIFEIFLEILIFILRGEKNQNLNFTLS